MNTLRKYGAVGGGEKYNVVLCTFAGLSTDTKPVGTVVVEEQTVALANGSLFIEMDTNKRYRYDASNQVWNEVS